MNVPTGGIVTLLGGNGTGKSTLLKAISGLLPLMQGDVFFNGVNISNMKPHQRMRLGLVQVTQAKEAYPAMTVEENLVLGAYTRRDGRTAIAESLEKVYHYFPRLKERRTSQAGYTSGGEQQMTAIGRALMANPHTILLDEPSMGLAPQLVEEIFEIVRDLNTNERVSFLLAEQNTMVALRFAEYGYILENGRVVMDGDAKSLRENEDVKEFYLGLSTGGRKSFREVKHYRRRKRWL